MSMSQRKLLELLPAKLLATSRPNEEVEDEGCFDPEDFVALGPTNSGFRSMSAIS